jgi:multidrug efflux system membrane fusion protein
LTTKTDAPIARDEALAPREEILPQRASEAPGRIEAAGGRSKKWPWLIGIGAAILLAILLSTRASQQKKERAVAAKKEAAGRAVPVSGVPARTGDLGVYISGLGTVTALNTVTVRSRVDGQLLRVQFREGQLIREGDLLAEIDPRPFQVQLMQAEGQKGKDEAMLANARVDLARYETLVKEDSIARQQLDTQAALVRQLEASVRSDQGTIESAKLNLVYCRITAPITGQTGLRLVDQGNIIHANDPNGLVVLTQLQPITVLFTVPADRLPQVLQQMRGSEAKLEVDAYDRDLKNKLATGTVLAVDNQIDSTTGTVKIKGLFSNEASTLYPNQFVNARLLVDTLKGATLIPAAAIQRSPQSTFVYAVKPDSTVDMRPVEVLLTEGDVSAIRKGVSPGEVVIIEGVDKLQPGTKVAVGAPGAPAPSPGGTREGAREGAPRKKA